jgi:hypothetical protein
MYLAPAMNTSMVLAFVHSDTADINTAAEKTIVICRPRELLMQESAMMGARSIAAMTPVVTA